mmetsp:Transcript_127059/g.290724  ORF Transcript_127059/g.290724 Transcript_127059/m.290724 type:complete len:231 (+) Transcript_127059:54-746(+)
MALVDDLIGRALGYLEAGELLSARASSRAWERQAGGGWCSEVWEREVEGRFPRMADSIREQGGECDWARALVARCRKKAEWTEQKGRGKQLKAERSQRLQQAEVPVTSSGKKKTVREKVCRKCGQYFQPAVVQKGACVHHPGIYEEINAEGKAIVDHHQSVLLQRQIQHILKKRASKKKDINNHIEIADVPGCRIKAKRGSNESQRLFRWSCCGEEVLTKPGCTAEDHCA